MSGTFKPTNYSAGDTFPDPAPPPSGTSDLSVFDGSDANGTWSLYVVDDLITDAGTIASGWSLSIRTTGSGGCPTGTAVATAAQPTATSVSTAVGATATIAEPTATSVSTAVEATATTEVTETATSVVGETATTEPEATATAEPEATSTPIADCLIQFSDVTADNPFYSYVHCLACLGIISGYPDGTFRPDSSLTRGQLAKIVSNAAQYNDQPATQTFEDVGVGSAFYVYVERMVAHGVLGGYECGGVGEQCVGPGNRPYFRPDASANRGQITKIVANATGMMGTPEAESQMFQDVPDGSTFYGYVEMLGSHGIMGGYPCGGPGEPCGSGGICHTSGPNSTATRGQLSKIVSNSFFPDCQVMRR